MSWYELKRQFIDAAARTLWAGAWGDHEEETCETCGQLLEGARTAGTGCNAERGHRARSFAGVNLCDIAPPTPDYARLEAAILLAGFAALYAYLLFS